MVTLHAQPLQFTPEVSYTIPTEGFEANDLLSGERGLRYGLHLDKVWGKLGLGLYAGYGLNDFSPRNIFPPGQDGNLISFRNLSSFEYLRWKGYQGAIGPVLQLGKKFNVQLYAKAGATIFDHRAYSYILDVREPVERVYTVFEVNSTELEKDVNLLLLSGLRLNIPLSERVQLSLGANYTHIRDVVHSYTYLDADFSPNTTEAELVEVLSTAPTVTEVRECHFNTIGLTVGISFNFGPRPPADPIVDTPPSIPPTDPDFSCDELTYEAPGFNDVYTLREKNRVTFEWQAANVPGISYELVLYARDTNGNYRSIYQTITSQNRHELDLNDLNGIANNEVYWEVNPIINGTDYCPFSNTKMRIHVFRDKEAAEDALPGCKL